MAKEDTSVPKKGRLQKLIKLEDRVSDIVAHPYTLVLVLLLLTVWLVAGLIIGANIVDWKEVIHIPIFITTFLLLFILQSSQKQDTEALHAKLDELIKSLPQADNSKVKLEKKLKGHK